MENSYGLPIIQSNGARQASGNLVAVSEVL
jgi:hypothetical protein